jgi:hypothetical protein
MARALLNVVAPCVALICVGVSIYYVAVPCLSLFDLGQYVAVLRGLIAAAVLLAGVLLGLISGMALYPVLLRPVISGSDFWGWLGHRDPIKLPFVKDLLLRWYQFLYGARPV